MPGTKEGGLKAKLTNLKRQGPDYYARIGRLGGMAGHTGGFAANPELAKIAGRKGGMKSKRGKAKRNKDGSIKHSYDYIRKHLQGVQ